ncbi:vWA domain-containing protein [Kaarinaea lacus]
MKRKLVLVITLLLIVLLIAACSTPNTAVDDTNSKADDSAAFATNENPGSQASRDALANEKTANEKKVIAKNKSLPVTVDESVKDNDVATSDSTATLAKPRSEAGKQEAQRRLKLVESEIMALQQQVPAEAVATAPVFSQPAPAMKRMQSYTAPSGIAPNLQPQIRYPSEPLDRENYAHFDDNPVLRVAEKPVSTFSIDVDTGSYTNTRRILHEGRLPAKDVVRVEEFINYFNYDYPVPENKSVPFNVVTEVGPTPWNPNTHLLHIGIKGYEVPATSLPPSNVVFLVDVSGSMQSTNKLPLLKKSLQMLAQKLRAEDKISLVVYAGASGVVLEPTSGSDKATILSALEALSAGGSTNGAAGIRLAYLKAEQAFIKNGINRVILATDGDFNVGTTNFEALKNLVEEKRKTGIFLTTLGFGSGNYNDKLMEQLADVGNGNYAYIDTLLEAQKVLINEMGSTLKTIAKDVKIQIEFNPAVVAEYRLIGYENRALRREDFNNDKVDAGEIGAGHTVTAIYEISLAGKGGQLVDSLRYQPNTAVEKFQTSANTELAFLRLRYKQPDSDTSTLIETPIQQSEVITAMNKTSERFQFAASVAGFGQLLRGGRYTQHYSYADIVATAVNAKGVDRYGYRSEFVRLVELANTLSASVKAPASDQAVN